MIYTLYIVKYCKKIMSKGPLIIYCTGGIEEKLGVIEKIQT